MYFLSKMGIFQPAMLVYQAGYQSREVLKLSKSQRAEIASVRIGEPVACQNVYGVFSLMTLFKRRNPGTTVNSMLQKFFFKFYVHKTFQEG